MSAVDLKVNGRMLKLMHLNQIRSPNHSFKLSKNCNNTDIFKTKWMDKLNMSEIKTGRRLFSQGKEQDLSSLNDGCKDRSQFPKLKVSLPVKSRGRMPFGLNHPTIRVKCEMPLSSLSQASKRNLPLIHSPVTSTKTLVEV